MGTVQQRVVHLSRTCLHTRGSALTPARSLGEATVQHRVAFSKSTYGLTRMSAPSPTLVRSLGVDTVQHGVDIKRRGSIWISAPIPVRSLGGGTVQQKEK